jgi:hypothetical protein
MLVQTIVSLAGVVSVLINLAMISPKPLIKSKGEKDRKLPYSCANPARKKI